ncbi:hypothetical protein TNCV_1859111 [Trichonephila clavipes]|nr:hypothetical protein TNCV_1859111 [Trichonephila clavipes]
MQVTVHFSSVQLKYRGRKPWGSQGPPTNHTRGLAAGRLFRVPPCRKGTVHLETPMSSPGFEPCPYGSAVSVANHYTGWATTPHMNITYRQTSGLGIVSNDIGVHMCGRMLI